MKVLSLVLVAGALCASGCMTDRQLLATFPVVSMTKLSTPAGSRVVAVGNTITESYCVGDKAVSTQELTVGLVDELVTKGQNSTKSEFLTEVNFFRAQGNCYELEFKAGKQKKAKPAG